MLQFASDLQTPQATSFSKPEVNLRCTQKASEMYGTLHASLIVHILPSALVEFH